MSRKVYDNWEKLVEAVLRREEDRRLALCSSVSTASSADSIPRSTFADSSIGDVLDSSLRFRFDFSIRNLPAGIDEICKNLGLSGIDDLSISPEEYRTLKARSSCAAAVCNKKIEDVNFGNAVEISGYGGRVEAVDLLNGEIKGVDHLTRYSDHSGEVISGNSVETRANSDTDRSRLLDSVRVSDEFSSDNASDRSNKSRGSGIKGVRPPLLIRPPLMSLRVPDKECSTGDISTALVPDSDTSISRFEGQFYLDDDEEGAVEGGWKRKRDRKKKGRRRKGMARDTKTSNDDYSSRTKTEPMSSISPNGRFRRVISAWQKGDLLGRGSFASVYEAIADDGFFFAVKEVSLLDQTDEGKQCIIQLKQEIALLSQFDHENIVQYYDTMMDESHLYIFLELVNQGSLLKLYQKYTLKDSVVSGYTRQILHGLKYLHDRNVVHRDIKCANLLVDSDGSVKLADFGLGKSTKLNDVKSCKGTAFWMAPEVVRGEEYGLAADIWSLGCTVLEMLTRHFPYYNLDCVRALFRIGRGERPSIPDSLSSDARDFIVKCLQVDSSLRPTAAQLLNHPFVKRPLPLSSGFTSPQNFARQI